MTDLSYLHSSPVARTVPWVGVLYALTIAAMGASLSFAITAQPATTIEWQLVVLLRFMAVVKGAMALGAIGLTHWRLRQPIGDGPAAGYVGALALMLMAPGLIWSLAHIALGAGLFHAGLLTFLVLAWRDDGAGNGLPRASRT